MRLICFLFFFFNLTHWTFGQNNPIPLPEHPRPDFERKEWINLNGQWNFTFDPKNEGLKENWQNVAGIFSETILVPFPWGSELSGVKDEADIAWYERKIKVDKSWSLKRTFIVIGASDWQTTVFLDGVKVGMHEGGYTPFSFDLTKWIKYDKEQSLVIRVDDKRRMFTLYGKQGYGNARGIWQTVYLESRGEHYLEGFQIQPDIDRSLIKVKAILPEIAKENVYIKTHIKSANGITNLKIIPSGSKFFEFEIPINNPHLWSLEDPYLYDYQVVVGDGDRSDVVNGYFGMRKISVQNLPNSDIPYISINNQPVYLQLALDQSYHPQGFYTFPSDEFMRDEIIRSKKIGLNGIRTHIKAEIPRKLYWADKLGLLVMADLPNSWGEPDADMRKESEYTLKEMINRDFNHPAIFSWITFNETWGLISHFKDEMGNKKAEYLPETQKWVASVYRLAKSLDPSRLVEDNSICCGKGHTETDIHSWHAYLPGYEWDAYLKNLSDSTYAGSSKNFEKGYVQGKQPMINSEFGNVWGYKGSTGDVDYTWDYHKSMNSFRNHLKVAGWLYTEHHDVINEWNGYYRFDRSEKETGLGALSKGMTLKDLHAEFYLSTGQEIAFEGKAGDHLKIPLTLSSLTNRIDLPRQLNLKIVFEGKTSWGEEKSWWTKTQTVSWNAWTLQNLDSVSIELPKDKSLNTLRFILEDPNGQILHQNFVSVIVNQGNTQPANKKQTVISVAANQFVDSNWTLKQWTGVLGNKVNGGGSGFFEYEFEWPKGLLEDSVLQVSFFVEASSKPLLGKDRVNSGSMSGDYMLGKGTFDPGKNPNAYPQTDLSTNPSTVQIYANKQFCHSIELPDDPADHQGVLSWFYQAKNHVLDEAGTYGYWIQTSLPKLAWQEASYTGKLRIRLEVPEALPNGLAVFGSRSGRYIAEPSLVITRK